MFRFIRTRVVSLALAALLGSSWGVDAATVGYLTDGQLAQAADRVVHGRVVAVRQEAASGGRIYTVATVEVLEDLTGAAGQVVEIRELGGRVEGRAMVVPGQPTFAPGQEILACLERAANGQHRLVALGFSLFDVAPEGAAEPGVLRRQDQDLVVLDRPVREGGSRTLREFRQVVSAIRGTVPVRYPAQARRDADAGLPSVTSASTVAAAATTHNFTLLGGGTRWNEVDRGAVIQWFRNLGAPPPLDGSEGTPEILTALSAWTAPPQAVIALEYGGGKDIGGNSPYCDTTNAGVGLISFEDPTNELASGVLAIGGGCSTTVGRVVVNGATFDSFTHGFAVFNTTAEAGPAYRTSLNFSRLVEHEVGHGIGLGHNVAGAPGAQGNIMYATCCYASTPVPPALGPDDLAGIEFIYPLPGGQVCQFTVAPTQFRPGYLATDGAVAVQATPDTCSWTAESDVPWISLRPPTTVTGAGRVSFQVEPNRGAERRASFTVAGQTIDVLQDAYDSDGDGLPDSWEQATGLDPFSAAGDNGAEGDPDQDGLSNLEEWRTGGHPRGFYRTTLAEGASSTFFFTDIAIAAAQPTARGSFFVRYAYALPGRVPDRCEATFEVAVDRWFHIPVTGCGNTSSSPVSVEVSATLETDVPVVVERTMSWPLANGGVVPGAPTLDTYGAHAEGDFAAPATRWYFAEGATYPGFDLFYLLRNVETTPITITATYLRPAPLSAIVKTYSVAPDARLTVWANVDDERLDGTEVAAVFESDGGRFLAERAMYASTADQAFAAGTAAMGAPALATRWLFAEGATGPTFDSFLLFANPGGSDAVVQVRYLLPLGSTVVKTYTVGARSRLTVWVDRESAALADTTFGADVVSTNGVPVVVERVMWWPGQGGAGTWQEAHASGGATTPAAHWLTSDGECGGERSAKTYLLVVNPGGESVDLDVRLHFAGEESAPRRFRLLPRARLDIDVGASFPEADGRRFAADVAVVAPARGAVVVERSTYWDGRTQAWAAGVNVRATPIP